MLVLSDRHVHGLLTYDNCIPVIRDCLKAVSADKAIQPMRSMIKLPNVQGIMGWMPGCVTQEEGRSALGFKLITVVPTGKNRTAHHGAVTLFDETSGHLIAMIEAGSITAIRTPAASAVATDLLSRPDSQCLAILGSGHQAREHLAAIRNVRAISQVKIWSLNLANATSFANEAMSQYGIDAIAYETVEETVKGADIICTATAAADPILKYEWIAPGTHINAIGSSIPMTAEIDTETVAKSSFFVDHKETISVQGGEYRRALEAEAINENHIQAELGEILLGSHPGRQSEDEITVYKSVGIVAYDLAAAHAVYELALKKELGSNVELLSQA